MTETAQSAAAEQAHLLDVAFFYTGTNETARFAVPGDVTLQQAWDMAYIELKEARQPADTLEARHTGASLAGDLDKTVRYVKDHVVPDLHFQIHTEKGGA
jgi:hypothetical protein